VDVAQHVTPERRQRPGVVGVEGDLDVTAHRLLPRRVSDTGGQVYPPPASTDTCSAGGAPFELRQPAPELAPGGDAELREHLVQVVLRRTRADEQLGTDLGVGVTGGGQLGDLRLLRGE